MTAIVSAEILRLRTVAIHRWVALGILALMAVNAAPFVGGVPANADELTAQLRGLVQVGVLLIGAYAANVVADEFRRGAVAATYLVHAAREKVAAAQALTFGAFGMLLGGLLAGVAVALVLPAASGDGVDTGLSAAEVAHVIGGAAFCGAVLGATGALVGTVARHPGAALGAFVVWNLAETLLTRAGTDDGIGDYLPIQLVGAATSLSDDIGALAAMAVLLGELAVLAIAVRRWALPRDLT